MAQKSVNAVSSVSLHLSILRTLGFYHVDRKTTSAFFRNLHGFYSAFAAVYCYAYVVLEILYVVENWGDIMETVTVSALLLTHIAAMCKQYVLTFKASRVQALVHILEGPDFNEGLPYHLDVIGDTISTCRFILIGYTSCAFATCCLWAVFPFLEGIDKKLPLRSTFPFSTATTPGYEIAFFKQIFVIPRVAENFNCPNITYEIAFFIQIFVVAVQALVITTTDHLIATLLANGCAQIKILCYNLEHLTEKAHRVGLLEDDYQATVERAFVKCVEHHKVVVAFVNEVERLFNFPILYQFGVSGTILCAIAYRMTDVPPASIEFVSMILFLICILCEIFMFCYYGNEIFIQSAAINQAIYSSGWLTCGIGLRRNMVIFMERSKRQIQVSAGNLLALSLSTFVAVVKFSYTSFAVLHGAKD